MTRNRPVLKTRLVGRTTHVSGHPMAPMDLVYEVEEPKRAASRRSYFSDEWSAPNPWVTAVIDVVIVVGFLLIFLNR